MKLIPASEVPSDQLSEFLGRVPEGEQAFLKENVPRSGTRAAWRGRLPIIELTRSGATRHGARSVRCSA